MMKPNPGFLLSLAYHFSGPGARGELLKGSKISRRRRVSRAAAIALDFPGDAAFNESIGIPQTKEGEA